MPFRERQYVCRGRTIRLLKPDGVVALRDDRPAAGGTRSVAALDSATVDTAAESAVGSLPADDVAAFRSAGWTFVAPTAARSTRAAGTTAEVLIEPSGRLVLATDRLTLKVKGPQGPEEDAARLAAAGVEVVAPLRFAPGLYQCRVTPGRGADVFEVSERLLAAGLVEFAEPDLIGAIGPRGGQRR